MPVNHDNEGIYMFQLVNFRPDQLCNKNRLGSSMFSLMCVQLMQMWLSVKALPYYLC